jgi:exosortase
LAIDQSVTTIEKPNPAVPSTSAAGGSILARWPLMVLVASVAVLYAPVLDRLVRQWYSDPEYSHGFLVPVISGFVLWRKRDLISKIPSQPSAVLGVVTVLVALVLLFLGSLGAELFLTRISLILIVVGLTLYFQGFPLLRALSFPIGFLLLAIPLPALIYNQIVFPLQLFASQLATGILDVTHAMPILREGNVLILPNTTLEVVEACSGIRSLMSLTTLAIGYGYLVEKSIPIRCLLAIGTVPVAVIANGTRVMVTALLSYYVNPKAAEGLTHEFSGIVIFIVATLMMLVLHATLVRARNLWNRKRAVA